MYILDDVLQLVQAIAKARDRLASATPSVSISTCAVSTAMAVRLVSFLLGGHLQPDGLIRLLAVAGPVTLGTDTRTVRALRTFLATPNFLDTTLIACWHPEKKLKSVDHVLDNQAKHSKTDLPRWSLPPAAHCTRVSNPGFPTK